MATEMSLLPSFFNLSTSVFTAESFAAGASLVVN